MLIGIDGNEANIKNRVGVGQYALNLLLNLTAIDKKNQYLIYLKDQPLKDLPKESSNWHYRIFGPKKLWTKLALPIHLYTQKEKLDLFFSPSHYSPSFCPCPTIPTIHDLGYLKYPHQFTQKDLYQLTNWTQKSILKAKKIITVSEFSKSEIKNIYHIPDSKINVAYNGVGKPPKISKLEQEKTLKKFNLNQSYFLYLGTLKPNKNIPFLIKGYSEFLRSKIYDLSPNLVIAGKKGWLFDEIFDTVRKEKLENRVIFTDFITETEKWTLYKNAICSILPSLYEGFGIPIIESMKVGTPVIASNIPVLKEVIGHAGIYIDPQNISDLSQKLSSYLDSKNRQKYSELGIKQSAKFTWVNTAKSVLKTFASI